MVNGSLSPGFIGSDAPGRMSGTLSPANAGVDAAKCQLVGVRMVVARDDLRHDDALELAAKLLHALDFEAEHGEALGQFLGRPGEINVLLEPVERYLHFCKKMGEDN